MIFWKWLLITAAVLAVHAYLIINPHSLIILANYTTKNKPIAINITIQKTEAKSHWVETTVPNDKVKENVCDLFMLEKEMEQVEKQQRQQKLAIIKEKFKQQQKLTKQKPITVKKAISATTIKKSVTTSHQKKQKKTHNKTNSKHSSKLLQRQSLRAKVAQVATSNYKKKPYYPEFLRRKGITGKVTLEVAINTKGKVIAATIIKSSGYSAFDRSALKTIKKWRYLPAQNCFKNVIFSKRLETIIFQLK